MSSIYTTLKSTGLPVAYGRFKDATTPPFIIYLGDGQDTMAADDGVYHKKSRYKVEYYFAEKREANENAIEEALTEAGYIYDKSEDVYISSEDLFVIYYSV